MLVGVVCGSLSDWNVMNEAVVTLDKLRIKSDRRVVSAHRTPRAMIEYAEWATDHLDAIIAGAGGAAHLPGMLASLTMVPVFGVPVPTQVMGGLDSLLSIVQMPGGVPVATFAVGIPGAINAALHVAHNLAYRSEPVRSALADYRRTQTAKVMVMSRETFPQVVDLAEKPAE